METFNFVDMDGVIANVSEGLQTSLGLPIVPPTDYNWCADLVDWSLLNAGFWEGLPVYEDTLIEMQSLENTIILTHCFSVDAIIGKRKWLDRYWPGIEMINLADKWLIAGPGRCLWDDYPVQIEQWNEAGGMGILIERAWNRGTAKVEK